MKRATQGFAAALTCILTLVLLVVPKVVVEAADPPYVPPPPPGHVAWDDNLIGQRLALTFAHDPNPYVTEGRFYDVGRNLDPIVPPAAVNPTDYGDSGFRVTHIKFDWKKNDITPVNDDGTPGTPTFSYDEAQTMMYDRGNNLDHVEDGKVKGEWIYKYATFDDDKGRSEPALYVAKKRATVKVRIECAGPMKYAYVGAKELRPPYPKGGSVPDEKWLDVEKTAVPFRPLIEDQQNGVLVSVSRGAPEQVGTDADGNPIYQPSEYVELPLKGTIKSIVDRSDIVWQWYVDRRNLIDDISSPDLQNEWTAAVVCKGNKDGWAINKSGEYGTIEIVGDDGEVQVYDAVLPHRFYTILDRSKYPWYDAADQSDLESAAGTRKPWANSLDFAIVTAGRVELRGFATLDKVAERVTIFCYRDFGLDYDHNKGSAGFVYTGGPVTSFLSTMTGLFEFQFHIWLADSGAKLVNCDDQALAASTITALIGGHANSIRLEPFGYIKRSDFVGDAEPAGNSCDSPFFRNAGVIEPVADVGDDDTCWRTGPPPGNFCKRSAFAYHTWMEFSGKVYDATAGDANGNAPRICANRSDYKAAVIDLSNTGVNPWEDNEEMACSSYQADGRPLVPAKDLPSDAPDPDYRNGDMTKAQQRTFTLN